MQAQTGENVRVPSNMYGIEQFTTPSFMTESLVTKQSYRIVLEEDEDGRIVARSLDLQGLVTDGATEDEAIRNAYEAAEGILEARGLEKEFNLIIVENTSDQDSSGIQ